MFFLFIFFLYYHEFYWEDIDFDLVFVQNIRNNNLTLFGVMKKERLILDHLLYIYMAIKTVSKMGFQRAEKIVGHGGIKKILTHFGLGMVARLEVCPLGMQTAPSLIPMSANSFVETWS